MKTIAKLAAVSLSLFLLQSLQAVQMPTLDQVLKNMEEANVKYPSIQANIERTIYQARFQDLQDPDPGKIWILKVGNAPRQIKIEFDKPKEFELIQNGDFKKYTPSTKEVEQSAKTFSKDEQAEIECVFLGLCQSSAVINKSYDASLAAPETVNGTKAIVLVLKTKDKKRAASFASIKLWLDPAKWIPVQTRVFQPNGNYMNAKFTNISTAKFSDSVFKLEIPKDASVKKFQF